MLESINKLDFSSIASSDNILAIIAFLIFMIVLFIIFLRVSVTLISYLFSLNGHVKLLNGTSSGQTSQEITQDPAMNNSKTVQRSFNKNGGIEFTWSVWLFVNSISTQEYQCVFVKGLKPTSGSISQVNCPGVYITNLGNVCIVVNTFSQQNVLINIPDIPLDNWFQLTITCEDKLINIYVNGLLIQSQQLISPVYQNYADVLICPNSGFDGFISNLWYWNRALSVIDIQRQFTNGPNTSTSSQINYKVRPGPNYLSLNYYIQ